VRIVAIKNDNRKSGITFGYNKPLNKVVRKVLSEELSPYNKMLLQLNKACNEAEDSLNIQANFNPQDVCGSYGEDTDKFMGLFIDVKMKLAESLKESFPQFNFPRIEAQGYAKEIGGDELSWKNELVYILEEVADQETVIVNMK